MAIKPSNEKVYSIYSINELSYMSAYLKYLFDSVFLYNKSGLALPLAWQEILYLQLRNCCVYLCKCSKNEMEYSFGRMHRPLIKDFTKGLEINRPMFYVHPPT